MIQLITKQNKQGEKEMKTKKEYLMQDQKVERSLPKLNSATQNENYNKSRSKRRRREDKKTLKKTEENKNQINYLNYNDSNKLCDMIKQLTQTLHQYMDTTNKEIENIKKIVNLNYKLTTEAKEKSENFKEETNDRIQNIIITQKELIQRWKAIGSQFESSIDNRTNFTNKPNKKTE